MVPTGGEVTGHLARFSRRSHLALLLLALSVALSVTLSSAQEAQAQLDTDNDGTEEPLTLGEALSDPLGTQQTSTSVVYVVDDSGSMDGDWPEVRAALGQVRDMSGVTNTKVALIAFGTDQVTLFGLTDHASAPWDTHIHKFAGSSGGTDYEPPLLAARAMLAADSATSKKIVFMTDGQKAYPTEVMNQLITDGVVVDTIAYGTHFSGWFDDIKKMAADTGGTYSEVEKPSTGTTNNPAVTAQHLEDILPEKVAENTTTLYLFDSTFSMGYTGHVYTWGAMMDDFNEGLKAVQNKVRGTATARAAVARVFGGDVTAHGGLVADSSAPCTTWSTARPNEPFLYEIETPFATGSGFNLRTSLDWAATYTDFDYALTCAYQSIAAQSGSTKRVVLVSDGIAGIKPSVATIKKYTDAGIPIDTVAIGAHADRVYMKSLADAAGGSFSVSHSRIYPSGSVGATWLPGCQVEGNAYAVSDEHAYEGDDLVFEVGLCKVLSNTVYPVYRLEGHGANPATVSPNPYDNPQTAPNADLPGMTSVVIIRAGQISKTVRVPTWTDTRTEGVETFQLVLSAVLGVSGAGDKIGIGTISDASLRPKTPAVRISAGTGVTEGNDAVFTLTADPKPSADITVTVNITQSGDYAASTTQRSVTIGTSGTATLNIATTDDSVEEADGSVTATVAAGSGYTVSATSSASVTVSDDDSSGTTTSACTTTATAADLVSSVRAYHDHNKTRADYNQNWFRVLIAFGEETSDTLTAFTVAEAEAGELIWDGWKPVREELERLEQQTADCAAAQTSSVPVVTISGGSAVTEGSPVVFTVSADPKPAADITVKVDISQSGDYASSTAQRTVTIGNGGTATLNIATTDDSTEEADGSVTATLATGTGYTVGSFASASVTVSDDDDPPLVCTVTPPSDDMIDLVRSYHDHNKTRSDYSNNWFRVLIAFGEETSDTLTAFTVAEAEAGELIWDGWKPVREELERLEGERAACATPSTTPVVSISGGSAVTEGGTAVFTLSASPKPSSSISVKVNITQSGSFATSTAQRTVSVGTSGSATLNVATTDDSLDEANGSVTATVTSGAGYTVGSSKAATVTVNDNDPTPVNTPVVSIAGGSAVTEGGNAVFTLSASPKPSSSVSVKVSISQSGSFAASTAQRTVSIGTSGSATLNIATTNDNLDEANGSVTATLATGSGYTLGSVKAATVTVGDNDPTPPQTPAVTISGGSAVTEGGNALFTLLASPKPSGVISVKVNITQSGSFAASTAQRTVIVGSSGTAILRVATTNDLLDEANGSVTATIAAGSGYTGSGSATVTVNDNDVPAVSITGGSAVTEGSAAVFTLTANPKPASSVTVKVNITQTGSYATSTSQRTVTIGTSGTATLNVATTNDSDDEPNGSITATLVTGAGYTLSATKAATVTVNDDDDPPAVGNIKISIADASGPEGREAYPVVSLSEAAGVEVRVSWRTEFHPTAQNYALSTRDYWNGSGTLVFAPGETTKTIELYLAQDQHRENDEVFVVILSNPTGATIERTQATITITDDD